MNQEQVLSIVRQVLLIVGGGLVTKGYVDSATYTALVGAIVTIIGSGWAIYTRRNTGLISAAAAVPEVSKIVASSATATSIPNMKVVSQ